MQETPRMRGEEEEKVMAIIQYSRSPPGSPALTDAFVQVVPGLPLRVPVAGEVVLGHRLPRHVVDKELLAQAALVLHLGAVLGDGLHGVGVLLVLCADLVAATAVGRLLAVVARHVQEARLLEDDGYIHSICIKTGAGCRNVLKKLTCPAFA